MLTFFKKRIIQSFDDSEIFLHTADKFRNDPITLVYLVNYLTKRYTLQRAKYLYDIGVNHVDKELLPDIEYLPRGCYNEFSVLVEKKNIIDLQASSIIPSTWKPYSIRSCIKSIGTANNVWKYDNLNHDVMFLFPLCYTCVYGGNHSLATGIIKNNIAKFNNNKIINLIEVYNYVKYKNGYFYFKNRKYKLSDKELISGVLFEIGRMILETGFSYDNYVNEYLECYNPVNSRLNNLYDLLSEDCNSFIERVLSNNTV